MAKESNVKTVTNFLADRLRAEGLAISKIVLFGSHRKGKATEGSDIDLAIVSEDFRNKDIFKRVELIKVAEIMTIKKFMVPLDIVMLTPEELESETSLFAEYVKQGEVLYAK
jgi:predicted nucleotidyltransferase